MERNVPKLRFKEFSDEWEKKHLSNMVERVVRKNKDNRTQRPLTISAQYGLVDQEEFFNKIAASKNLEGYYLLEKGEFAYNKSYSNGYPFGTIKRLDRYDNGAVSTLYICFNNKENYNSDYLVQYFESSKWHREVSMIAVEGARNHGLLNVSVPDFFDTIHRVPSLQEQERIANFLTKVDKIIEKQDEKVKNLEKYKKGMMQKIFSQEIRFKDENGEEYPDWEEKKLGELDIKLTRGPFGSYLKKEDMVQKNTDTYKVYEQKHAINKNCKLGTYYINREKYLKLKRFEVKVGDFIMSCSGTIGEIYKIPDDAEKGIINQALLKIEVQKSINENYFLYCFRENLNKLEVKGSGIKNITSVKFLKEEFTLQVPFIEEQKKISDFLSNIDNIILNENNKLEELKQWKKGLLQPMFI